LKEKKVYRGIDRKTRFYCNSSITHRIANWDTSVSQYGQRMSHQISQTVKALPISGAPKPEFHLALFVADS